MVTVPETGCVTPEPSTLSALAPVTVAEFPPWEIVKSQGVVFAVLPGCTVQVPPTMPTWTLLLESTFTGRTLVPSEPHHQRVGAGRRRRHVGRDRPEPKTLTRTRALEIEPGRGSRTRRRSGWTSSWRRRPS